MMRFLFGLAAVVAVYLGWQWYAGDLASAAVSPAGDPAAGPFVAAQLNRQPPAPAKQKSGGGGAGADAGGQGRSGADKRPRQVTQKAFVDAVRASQPKALAASFRRLRAVEGADYEALSAALSAAIARTDSVEGLLGILGQNNAFLHSEVGRQATRKLVTKILAESPETAVTKMSGLLERCMRGPIAATDQAPAALVDEIYRRHKILVDRVLFNSADVRQARSYLVKRGDTLDGIAALYRKQEINVEGWTLCYVNRIGRPTRLRAGVKIKIPIVPIWAKLEKASFLMAVYLGKSVVRLYWVAHGSDDRTPVTTFTVESKIENPDWYAPDGNVYPFGHPKNVLGRYFVKFRHESYQKFGAHGTAAPETIRSQASLGCIRMYDKDIEEFSRLVPAGAKIVIADTR